MKAMISRHHKRRKSLWPRSTISASSSPGWIEGKLFVVIAFLFLGTFAVCQRIDGQFFTPGLLIINGPSPNSEKEAGKKMSISLEITGDGVLPRSNTDAGSNLATAILGVEIYLISRDMNMTVSQGPQLMQGERGSSVKHMDFKIPQCMPPGEYQLTFHELDRINGQEFYSIYSIPLSVKSQQEAGSDGDVDLDPQSRECSEAPAPQPELKDRRPSKQPFPRKGATGFEIQKGKMPLPENKNAFVPEVQITTFTVDVKFTPAANTAVRLSPPPPLGASIPDPVPESEPAAKPASPIPEVKPPPPSEVDSVVGPLEVRPAAPIQETEIPPLPASPVSQTRIPPLEPASPVQETRIPPLQPPDAKRVTPPPPAKPPTAAPEVKKEAFSPPIEKNPDSNQSSSQTLGSDLNSGSLNTAPAPLIDSSSNRFNNTVTPPKAEKPLPPSSNKAKPPPRETPDANSPGDQTSILIVGLKSQFHNQSQPAKNGETGQPPPDFLRDVTDLSKVKTAITMPATNGSQSIGSHPDSFSVPGKSNEDGAEGSQQGIGTSGRSTTQLVFSVPLIAPSSGNSNYPVWFGLMKYFYFPLALSYVYDKLLQYERMEKRTR